MQNLIRFCGPIRRFVAVRNIVRVFSLAQNSAAINQAVGKGRYLYLAPIPRTSNEDFGKTFDVFRHAVCGQISGAISNLERFAKPAVPPGLTVRQVFEQGAFPELRRSDSRPAFENPAEVFEVLKADFFGNE